jgi:hypothetical protein
VSFTPADLARMEPLVRQRQALSRGSGTVEKAVVSPPEYMRIIHLGVMGEWAVAEWLHGEVLEPDGIIGAEADVLLPSNESIEVKTTRRRQLNFILFGDDPERFKGTYGVLCWPHEQGIEIVGWITREQWLAGYEVRRLRVPTMLFPWEEMESMWLFPALPLAGA